jgi:hypothetical protein
MRWGEKELTALCRPERIDPDDGGVFLFFNARRDALKPYSVMLQAGRRT